MAELVNPWGDSGDAWDRITLAGVTFHGKVEVSGTPWKKKTDHRRGRGRNGGRTVAAGWDLGEWSVTLTAWEEVGDDGVVDDSRVLELRAIIRALTDAPPATQDTHAVTVSHPAFAVAGVNQVTFQEGDVPEPDPVGKIAWKFKVKEFKPPPPRPVVRTPAPAPQAPTVEHLSAAERSRALTLGYRPVPLPPPTADP